MAELNDSTLKNLDSQLTSMLQHLQSMETVLRGVKGGIDATFNPAVIREWNDALRGMKATRIIDAEQAVGDISTIKSQIRLLTREVNEGKGFRLFTPQELSDTQAKLAEVQAMIAILNKDLSKGTISNEDVAYLAQLRSERTDLKNQLRMGGVFDTTLSEAEIRQRIEMLARYKNERDNIMKGEQQRSIELANIKKREADEVENANKREQNSYRQALREAEALAKKQRETETQIDRIKHNRDIRDKRGIVASPEVIDAESRKLLALGDRLDRIKQKLADLDKVHPGISQKALINQEPYREMLNANEDLRYYRALEKIGDQHSKNTDKTKQQERALRDVEMTAQRLRSVLAYTFGIYQIRNFLSNLVKIRGEFEMSEVALRNIIGNSEKTQLIWKKTMNLAVNSPLTAKQLTQYTKQLAAFRIETNKLYDTTKMLGDVAVGLGVDMQRLILAYGHTKSSGFLRGMYARQFATAGVNIYGELADYYSQIEGKMVSFKDVYERISKKMVTFADVEKVFQKITSKGGTFYNMQEVLTDTVQGQINKIRDSWQQAMNELGKDDTGIIRGITDLILNLVKNWRLWISVIKASVTALVAFKAINIASALLSTSYAANIASKSTLRLAGAMKALGKSVYKNWKALVISLAAAGVVYMVDAARNVRKFNEDIDEQTVKLYDAQQKMNGYVKRVKENNAVLKESQSTSEELKVAREDNNRILQELQREYPELYDGVKQLANGEVILTDKIEAHNQSLREQIRLTELLKQENFAEDPFEKDARQYFDKLSEMRKEIEKTQHKLKLDLAHGGIDIEEDEFARAIIGIDTSNILVAVKQYNGIINTARGQIEEEASKLEETYKRAVTELSKEMTPEATKQMNEIRALKLNAQNLWNEAAQNLGLYDVGKFVPISTDIHDVREFNQESQEMIKEMLDGFELAVRNIDGEEQKITEKYNERLRSYLQETGIATEDALDKETKKALNVEAFRDYFIENSDRLLKMVQDGTIDVNETIRTFLSEHGQALTDENKRVWNIILNNALTGANMLDKVYEALEKSWVQKNPFLRKVLLAKADEIMGGMYDFFAEYQSPTSGDGEGDDSNKTYKSLDDLLSLLKTMNSEYDKLSKSAYGYAKSQKTVMEVFRESFKDIFKTTQGLNKLDDVLTMINFDSLDITSKQGLANAFQELYDFLEKNNLWGQFGKDADKLRAKLQKTIDMQEVEVGMDVQIRLRNDFGKQVEKAFSDYELTLEMQKLDIPKDMVKDIFPDFDYTSLGKIQDLMQSFYESQRDADGNVLFDEEDLKEYKKWSDKIDAEILKYRKERAKEYSKFLEKEYSERAKLQMKHAKDVAFVTANFTNEEQRANILEGINKKFQDDLNKLEWKSFKESSFYVDMMDDLASLPREYLQLMLDKLDEIIANPQIDSRLMKEAIKDRQKVMEAQINLKPLKVMRSSIQDIREAMADEEVGGWNFKKTNRHLKEHIVLLAGDIKKYEEEILRLEDLQSELAGFEQLQEELDTAHSNVNMGILNSLLGVDESGKITEITSENIDTILSKLQSNLDKAENEYDASVKTDEMNARAVEISQLKETIALLNAELDARKALGNYVTSMSEPALTQMTQGQTSTGVGMMITSTKGQKNKAERKQQTFKEWLKSFDNFSDAFKKFNENLNNTLNSVKGMGNAFYDMFDALGGETDALTEGWKEFGNTMIDTITQTLTMIPVMVVAFTTAGTAINAALGIIGLIAEALQLLFVAIGAIAKLHDAGYEKEIEIQQEKIDSLTRAYERLEKQIDKTFESLSYMQEYSAMAANLYAQVEALNAQYNAEEAKKNSDKDKLQDYKDKIQDAEDELEELKQKQIEVFGGIGEEGYRDAAQGFVAAWKSAFLETGDGLQGLQDHFDEFLNEWFVKQATMRVAGKMLEPLFRDIDDAVDKYSDGGTGVMMDELEKVRERFGIIAPELSAALEEMAGWWNLGGEGSLSGLAAGIQGMTEEQANILEAYWNSVRGYTASIDANVATIVGILTGRGGRGGEGGISGGIDYNPQLQQMELIAQNTKSINTLLQAVTKSGHSLGGQGIKVFLN